MKFWCLWDGGSWKDRVYFLFYFCHFSFQWNSAHDSLLITISWQCVKREMYSRTKCFLPWLFACFQQAIPPLPQTGKFKSTRIFMWGNTWTYEHLKVICIYHLCATWLGWVESGKSLSVRCADRKHLGLEPPATALGCLRAMETPTICWWQVMRKATNIKNAMR